MVCKELGYDDVVASYMEDENSALNIDTNFGAMIYIVKELKILYMTVLAVIIMMNFVTAIVPT